MKSMTNASPLSSSVGTQEVPYMAMSIHNVNGKCRVTGQLHIAFV